MGLLKVLIADDDDAVREALAALIKVDPSLELVGVARNADEAIDLARGFNPDVALVDVRMPAGGGSRAAREIRGCSPQTHVVALSAYGDRGAVMEMLGSGAEGYLVKGTSAAEIIETIFRAVKGEARLSTEITGQVVHELAEQLQRDEQQKRHRQRKTQRIRQALEPGAINMVFQPIANLSDARIVGFESLARFALEPHRNPDVWFAEAEEIGLRAELELAAVREALSYMPQLPDGMYLSVNLSPTTAGSSEFSAALAGIPTERLVIEVTEHARVKDYGSLEGALRAHRSGGLRLAVDDAGAGYASLRHILNLEPDLIKLDVGITRSIDTDVKRRALAAALISFASEIGATIVAEGIETLAELAALRELGVPFGQGYYLARPTPLPSKAPWCWHRLSVAESVMPAGTSSQ